MRHLDTQAQMNITSSLTGTASGSHFTTQNSDPGHDPTCPQMICAHDKESTMVGKAKVL